MNTRDHSPSVLPGEHLQALRARLRGDVLLPGDAGWDAARQAWQVLVDQHPAAVVVAADADDVAATVRAARQLGLCVVPQSTGHAAGTVETPADSILLRTTRMDDIEIDPGTGRARVGAGASLGAVAAAAAEHGLAVMAGMSPTVGVVGFTLGGGLGWLSRSHGLAANSVIAVEAVDADGRAVRAHADHHADLFWAARGGVAPVVVTALELQLHPLAELHAGSLLWPIEHAADVAHAWRDWVATMPDTVTSLARVLRYPPIPEIPDFLRGRAFVAVEAALQADADESAELLRPLRELRPEFDTVRAMSPVELGTVHGDPLQPAPAHGAAVVLSEISTAAIDALVTAALDESAASLVSIELRHLGGELAHGRGTGGAVASVDGAGLVFAVGIVTTPESLPVVRDAASAVLRALQPFASRTLVKNFAETPAPAEELYGGATERVRQVAADWDPERIIRTGHPLD